MQSGVPLEGGLVSAVIRQARHQLLLRQQSWTALEPLAVAWRDSLYGPRGRAHHLSVFLAAFQQLAGGPSAVWALSRATGLSQWGATGYGLMTSPHALAALQLVVQWQALTPLGFRCDLQPCAMPEKHAQGSQPGWRALGQVPAEGEGIGYWLFVLGCRLTLLESVGVNASAMTQLMLPCEAEPEALSMMSSAGLSVVFGARGYEELYTHDTLIRPNPHSSPDVHRAVCQTAGWPNLATLDAHAPIRAQDPAAEPVCQPGWPSRLHCTLQQAIHAELDRGQVPTLASVAPKLRMAVGVRGTGVRQLQRHLAAAHLSFRAVVAEVRRERALVQLRESRKPLAEIAAEAGYAEPSSFHRAVRRWTGTTPLALRSLT
jgi:AraC-like DNA-binding protein